VILRYLTIVGDAPEAYVILIAAFVASMLVGLIFHEFCHAFVADSLGDRTPRAMGRLTLNPKAHYDPLGTTLIFFVGFGWAKPVPVNPYNTKNPRSGMAMIAFAGPLSNLVVAGLAGIPIRLGWVEFWHPFVNPALAGLAAELWTQSTADLVGLFLGTVVILNVILAMFNLLPIPPLDGSRVLPWFLPEALAVQYSRLEPWGFGILMILIMLGFVTGGEFGIFRIIGPFLNFFLQLFVGDPGVRF
jgi:Zn-dependent protease